MRAESGIPTRSIPSAGAKWSRWPSSLRAEPWERGPSAVVGINVEGLRSRRVDELQGSVGDHQPVLLAHSEVISPGYPNRLQPDERGERLARVKLLELVAGGDLGVGKLHSGQGGIANPF